MRRKSLTITFLILLSAFAYAADLPDLSEYSKAEGAAPPLVFMEDFSGGLDSWEHSPAVGIDRHGGMNGTAALCLQRTREQKGRYQDAIVTLKADACVLKKGKTYVFRGYYRTEDVPEDTRIQTIPSVTTITEGYSAEHYPKSYPKPSKEWKKVEIKFTAGETQRIVIRLWWDIWGKAWWDDISISEDTARIGTMYPAAPYALRLDERGRIAMKVHVFGASGTELQNYLLLLESGDRRAAAAPGSDGIASFEFGELPRGAHNFKATLLDPEKKLLLIEDDFTLFRNPDARPRSTSVSFDANGRMLIDGKPFMPVGMFASQLRTEEDLKRLADAGFNSVLNYRSFSMDIQAKPNAVSEAADRMVTAGADYGTPVWREKQKRSLDLLEKYGLKLIVASSHGTYDPVYEHPAVLGYYIADEATVDKIPELRKIREKWSEASPFRPVIALTFRSGDLADYGKICDVVSFDQYPIHTRKDVKTLGAYYNGLRAARATGLPVMGVPQFFNNGFYAKEAQRKKYLYPTKKELRSQALLNAIMGNRWFCAYSYTDAWERAWKLDPDDKGKFWTDVAAAAKVLRLLEPWLMSLDKAPPVKMENIGVSEVFAASYLVGGQMAVLLVNSGPGEGMAILHAGRDGLRSATGGTIPMGGGKYLFHGSGIDSDILYEGNAVFPVERKNSREVQGGVPERPLEFLHAENIKEIRQGAGSVSGKSAGKDPLLLFRTPEFEAEQYVTLAFEYRVSQSISLQLFWKRAGERSFSEKYSSCYLLPSAGQWKKMILRLEGKSSWNGRIDMLRLDPGSSPGISFSFRNLRMLP